MVVDRFTAKTGKIMIRVILLPCHGYALARHVIVTIVSVRSRVCHEFVTIVL